MDTSTYRFSVSALKEYEQCGLKFKLGRIDRIPRDSESTHHRWVGKVVHASIYASIADMNIEEGFKAWEIKREFPDISKSRDFFEAAWEGTEDTYLKSVIALEAGEKPESYKFLKGKIKALESTDHNLRMSAWKKVAWEMVENGVYIISRLPKIVEVEKKIEFTYQERNFIGYIDMVALNTKGEYIFLDFKTSWAKPSPTKIDEDIQFIFYSQELKKIMETEYAPQGYYVHLRSKSVIQFEITDEITEYLRNKVSSNFSRLEKGLFFSSKGSPLCPYCDFYSHCYGEVKSRHS